MDIYNYVLQADGPILLLGETGVGKSSYARDIFRNASSFNSNFVRVNLSSLSENIIESEIFGHEKGSFTGALKQKLGLVDQAQNGHLFLDEIGECSKNIQLKLLDLLDNGVYFSVGSTSPKKFKGRIICATNMNLHNQVLKGSFRKDLYYRMSTYELLLPPLRESSKKLQKLLSLFLRKYKKKFNHLMFELSPEVLSLILKNDWPGNIRELKCCIEYLVSRYNRVVYLRDIPERFQSNKRNTKLNGRLREIAQSQLNFKAAMEEYERLLIEAALLKNNGRLNKTATYIKISKTTLIARMRKYGLVLDKIKRNLEIINNEF